MPQILKKTLCFHGSGTATLFAWMHLFHLILSLSFPLLVHVDIFDILYPSPATHYSRGGEWYFFPHISYSNTAFNPCGFK